MEGRKEEGRKRGRKVGRKEEGREEARKKGVEARKKGDE